MYVWTNVYRFASFVQFPIVWLTNPKAKKTIFFTLFLFTNCALSRWSILFNIYLWAFLFHFHVFLDYIQMCVRVCAHMCETWNFVCQCCRHSHCCFLASTVLFLVLFRYFFWFLFFRFFFFATFMSSVCKPRKEGGGVDLFYHWSELCCQCDS